MLTLTMLRMHCVTLVFLVGIFSTVTCENEEFVEMKIVDEPSSFGLSNQYGNSNSQPEDELKPRVQPANFSGPPHFKRLIGRCFSNILNDYKYKFCPFANVTQFEQGVHWNPYKGVLGVYQEWEVINNTFVAMVMKDGDPCGSIFRSVKISFVCGTFSEIINASEPHTCSYHLVFRTPLVCHPHAMLVYPTLEPHLQQAWDDLELSMARGELTEKGYQRHFARIMEKAGIYMSKEGHELLVKKAEQMEQERRQDGEFESLDTCKDEFKKLQARVQVLEGLLEQNANFGANLEDEVQYT